MNAKPILTALAVAVTALAQPALAGFTQNEKGEVTHYNGIPLPPIQSVEEAKAQAQKEIAAAKKAREAQQAEQPATRHSSPATPPQEVFFTGKPYLEETGQYLFLFRHYDPELARWTTADPSGFPDGANNNSFVPAPTFIFDPTGLAWQTYYQFFGRSWTTTTLVTIEKNVNITLSGFSFGVGVNASGPTGQVTTSFSVNTTSTIVNESSYTQLTSATDNPNPTGEGWSTVGSYTTTAEGSNSSKVVHNEKIGPDRYRSQWNTYITHVGYIKWQKWVE